MLSNISFTRICETTSRRLRLFRLVPPPANSSSSIACMAPLLALPYPSVHSMLYCIPAVVNWQTNLYVTLKHPVVLATVASLVRDRPGFFCRVFFDIAALLAIHRKVVHIALLHTSTSFEIPPGIPNTLSTAALAYATCSGPCYTVFLFACISSRVSCQVVFFFCRCERRGVFPMPRCLPTYTNLSAHLSTRHAVLDIPLTAKTASFVHAS